MNKKLIFLISLVFFIFFTGCGDSSDSNSNLGQISLSLTDASSDEYKAVYVTIDEIQTRKKEGSAWETIASPKKTYNLLKLINGVREDLGITDLDSGQYTMMRLITGDTPDDNRVNILSTKHPYPNYIISTESDIKELKVPSGDKTGIKINCEFDINQNLTTEIILDFDAGRSVVCAGASNKWILKPVIKILETKKSSIISGTVTDTTGTAIEGVMVIAEQSDSTTVDDKDKVIADTSTLTVSDGSYKLFLKPGTYNIISYTKSYLPKCFTITTQSGKEYNNKDFDLAVAEETGALELNAAIIQADEDNQYITVSIRQDSDCSSIESLIEIKSINILNNESFTMILPKGTYFITASSSRKETETYEIIITKNQTETIDIEI